MIRMSYEVRSTHQGSFLSVDSFWLQLFVDFFDDEQICLSCLGSDVSVRCSCESVFHAQLDNNVGVIDLFMSNLKNTFVSCKFEFPSGSV